jgi:hypothetical protein
MTTRRPCPPAPGPDRAIRRHWTLVCCAFSFCWHAGQAQSVPAVALAPPLIAARSAPTAAGQAPARGTQQRLDPHRSHRGGASDVLAKGAAQGARLADPIGVTTALLARLVDQRATPALAAGA